MFTTMNPQKAVLVREISGPHGTRDTGPSPGYSMETTLRQLALLVRITPDVGKESPVHNHGPTHSPSRPGDTMKLDNADRTPEWNNSGETVTTVSGLVAASVECRPR